VPRSPGQESAEYVKLEFTSDETCPTTQYEKDAKAAAMAAHMSGNLAHGNIAVAAADITVNILCGSLVYSTFIPVAGTTVGGAAVTSASLATSVGSVITSSVASAMITHVTPSAELAVGGYTAPSAMTLAIAYPPSPPPAPPLCAEACDTFLDGAKLNSKRYPFMCTKMEAPAPAGPGLTCRPMSNAAGCPSDMSTCLMPHTSTSTSASCTDEPGKWQMRKCARKARKNKCHKKKVAAKCKATCNTC
jgi:hypothetical protein